MHLGVAGTHTVVVVDGHTHHLHTVVVFEQRLALLEWILGRYHKPHFVHIGQLKHRVGHNQVPYVDRVERAEKQTDVFHEVGRVKRFEGLRGLGMKGLKVGKMEGFKGRKVLTS